MNKHLSSFVSKMAVVSAVVICSLTAKAGEAVYQEIRYILDDNFFTAEVAQIRKWSAS